MMTRKTGDYPAFPTNDTSGMTIREYYAGQIMAALAASRPEVDPIDIPALARYAWAVADNLLAEQPQP